MRRIIGFITGRRTKWLILVGWLVAVAVAVPVGGKLFTSTQDSYETYLSSEAESTKVLQALKKFPGGDTDPMVVVYVRQSGVIPADRTRAEGDRQELQRTYAPGIPAVPLVQSKDGKALLFQLPISHAGDAKAVSKELGKAVDEIRRTVGTGGDGLDVKVTGAGAVTADSTKVFDDLGVALLVVPLVVVALMLLIIYRSPVLFLFPLLSVGLGSQLAAAAAYGVVQAAGLTVTSLGVGVFNILLYGAGTDYALLLIARYREELRRCADPHEAMRIALRRAAPGILASAATVAAGMLCLLGAAQNGTRGVGPVAALAMVGAVLAMLTLLPVLLLIAGRRVFWPLTPRVGDARREFSSLWEKVGGLVGARPQLVWIASALAVGICALGLVNVHTPQVTMFTKSPDSTVGQAHIEAHYSAGAGNPILIVVPAANAGQAQATAAAVPGVTAVRVALQTGEQVLLQATTNTVPYTSADHRMVEALRAAMDPHDALVGGDSAINLDRTNDAISDAELIIPLVLLVIMLILGALLRAVVLPVLLIVTVVLSFAAALGLSATVFEQLFHWKGMDPSLVLQAFVFLVALGVDYNIFLMSRVQEETRVHGHTAGTVRGLVVTGGVITSAGLVLAATFGVLAVLPTVALAQLGFVVAVGVLLDTLVVRSLLVPALTIDVGPRAWWPGRLSRGSMPRRSQEEVAMAGKNRDPEGVS
jgi:RND superfamily putative drug exporter